MTTIESWAGACAVPDTLIALHAGMMPAHELLELPGVLDAIRPTLVARIREAQARDEREAATRVALDVLPTLGAELVTGDPVANALYPLAVRVGGRIVWGCWTTAQLKRWADEARAVRA